MKRTFVMLFVLMLATLAVAGNVPKGIYYTINDGMNFFRSASPWHDGCATQSQNPRHITVSLSNQTGYCDAGFVLYIGKLGDIDSIVVKGKGDAFSLNFWFDKGKDGEFFEWKRLPTGGVELGSVGIDTYAFAPASQNGALTVIDNTPFYSMQDGQTYTLQQLKDGAMQGVGAETPIAVWVGVAGANTVARIDSVSINGQ
jgi:hypothetical protein